MFLLEVSHNNKHCVGKANPMLCTTLHDLGNHVQQYILINKALVPPLFTACIKCQFTGYSAFPCPYYSLNMLQPAPLLGMCGRGGSAHVTTKSIGRPDAPRPISSAAGAPLLMCRSLASQEDVSLKASHSSGLWLPTPRSLSGTPRAHRPHLCRAASPQSPGTSRLARFASPRVLSPSEAVNALGGSGGGTPDYYVAHSWRHPAKQAPRRPVPGGAMAAAEGSAGGVEAESEEERPVVRELGEYLRPGGKENAHTAADNSLWTV